LEDATAKTPIELNQNKIWFYDSLFLLTSDLCPCKTIFAGASWNVQECVMPDLKNSLGCQYL
jgi:hypothetical protein